MKTVCCPTCTSHFQGILIVKAEFKQGILPGQGIAELTDSEGKRWKMALRYENNIMEPVPETPCYYFPRTQRTMPAEEFHKKFREVSHGAGNN